VSELEAVERTVVQGFEHIVSSKADLLRIEDFVGQQRIPEARAAAFHVGGEGYAT
jgi:hypothetical protein